VADVVEAAERAGREVASLATVRCRLAPAPTGYLHVGNARTALYNWLFARHHGGAFVLRIEDTDHKRSTDEAIGIVIDSLRWLGLDWDEGPEVGGPYGPYRQTERLAIYSEVVDGFLAGGHAYPCYCTPEELEERRRAALARGDTPGYDGRCRSLTEEQRRAFEAEGRPKAVRFHMPEEDMVVHDLVRGDTNFPANDLRDFVILRSDGTPTYLLAAAVDDVRMEMTHVIRGEDLHPSTPRQLRVMEALGAAAMPQYAHLPLIVGADHKPLSKRHGSVSVEWYKERGFLPEALVNYLALLGWSYDESTTFMTFAELVRRFDLSRVSRNPAAFDVEKLEWMNGHYIRESDDARIGELVSAELLHEGVDADAQVVARAVPLIKERMKTIPEGAGQLRFLFVEELEPDEKAQKWLGPDRIEVLREAVSRLQASRGWTHDEIERVVRGVQSELGLSSRNAFMPIRCALTGSTTTPPLFESMELLGKERTLARLRAALERADGSSEEGGDGT
jgi:glutamyl-tRNA synthetase